MTRLSDLQKIVGAPLPHDDKVEEIDENFINKLNEMDDYFKKKYGRKFDYDEIEEWYKKKDDPLALIDPIYAKLKKQIITLDGYLSHSYDQMFKRHEKKVKNLAADIIKQNIKQYLIKKKAKVERTKLIKERNEAATKLQHAFQASKSQRTKNLPKIAKRKETELKAKVSKKRKVETAAEKSKRLRSTVKEIADSTLDARRERVRQTLGRGDRG